jgi:hypothetical protein
MIDFLGRLFYLQNGILAQRCSFGTSRSTNVFYARTFEAREPLQAGNTVGGKARRLLRVISEHDSWLMSMAAFPEGAVLDKGPACITPAVGDAARYGQNS